MAFDPQAATRAYIDSLGSEALAKAEAYTTGNHWLLLWGIVVSAVIAWLVIRSGVLDRVYARLENRSRWLRTVAVAATYLLVSTLIAVPWSIYTEWYRETQYDRTSQPLADYLSQSGIAVVINIVIGALFLLALYALIRRTARLWWAWGGALVVGFLAFILLLSPMVIEPLFNDFEPIPEGEVRDAVLAMADEAGIPEDRIFVFDGSRQSNNFTANVSGIGGSARIAISDVALGEASLDEVKAVTGHEIGHYVLGHVWRTVLVLSVTAILVLFLTARLYPVAARLLGSKAPIDDIRGLPVLVFVAGTLATLASPITNTLTRVGEAEADAYSLETVGLPDALSGALVKTAEYRYPRPGALEEMIFYTHPSVENRIMRAMEWKAQNAAAASPAP